MCGTTRKNLVLANLSLFLSLAQAKTITKREKTTKKLQSCGICLITSDSRRSCVGDTISRRMLPRSGHVFRGAAPDAAPALKTLSCFVRVDAVSLLCRRRCRRYINGAVRLCGTGGWPLRLSVTNPTARPRTCTASVRNEEKIGVERKVSRWEVGNSSCMRLQQHPTTVWRWYSIYMPSLHRHASQ